MKKFLLLTKLSLMVYFFLLCLLFLFLSLALSSCHPRVKQSSKEALKDSTRIEWNILFVSGTSDTTRNNLVKNIQNNIGKYYADKGVKTEFYPVVTCSCDPYLYKITFSPIGGAGESIVRPPKERQMAGEGGILEIKSISVNLPLEDNDQKVPEKLIHQIRNFEIDTSKILAIIDSGIDTSLFTGNPLFYNLMWKDPAASTLYNFIPSQPVNDYFDGTRVKHGSAVTSIALKAMEESDRYSKLMVLKALDNENKGSIFSVSCALSYAIQKKANVINLSLGYFGAADSILYHYLQLADTENPGIQIFAAAGNTLGGHNAQNICGGVNTANHLTGNHLFFPACFTPELKHLVSVTQLKEPEMPCYYQNYSEKYISLGIINAKECCVMPAGFSGSGFYEGSSFVTPVASGLKMMTMLKANSSISRQTLWEGIVQKTGGNRVTQMGKYIKYTPH